MKRIAIIEDNRIIQQLLSSWFDEETFEVLRLTDTVRLAERIGDFHPDLVITDIMLPNETPDSLISKLNKIAYPKIVLSSMEKFEVKDFADRIKAEAAFCKHSDIKDMFDHITDFFQHTDQAETVEIQ
jgi:DNA-binding response OmpR family regulator